MMKKMYSAVVALCFALSANAQFGFGGQQQGQEGLPCSERFTDVDYAGDGQAYHTLDIYLPESAEGKAGKGGKAGRYPVVVHIYGSAWFSNSGKGMADIGTICRAYLKAGYAVVCPNHRSSMDAKWPAQCHDIKAVIRFVRANAKRYGFDPKFVAVSGFSSGGHLSAVMAATSGLRTARVGEVELDVEGAVGSNLKQSSSVNAAVSWSGPIDLEAMDCGGRPNGVKGSPEEVLVGKPFADDTRDLFLSVSTTPYLSAANPPLIGFHGTADNVVPYCQAVQWDKTYTSLGVRHEFVTVEGGGHGFNMYSDENLQRAVRFLDEQRQAKRK